MGIGGIEEHVLKSATLSSSLACPSLAPMDFIGKPIVRVALDTPNISDMPALYRGLKVCVIQARAFLGHRVEPMLSRTLPVLERFVCRTPG